MKEVSNKFSIFAFIHCGLCLREWKKKYRGKISPKDFSKVQCGWTKQGLQIWCNRHNCNIIHISFDGITHRVNDTIPKSKRMRK